MTASAPAAQSRDGLLDALVRPRYEVLPVDGIEDAVDEHVPPEVKLTVTVSPTKGIERTLDVAGRLAARGYRVVPHLSARLVVDESHLASILERLRELELREAFVVAGDAQRPAGTYEGAAALLAAMRELGHGLDAIGITGYPESHPLIADDETIEAMFAKERFASYIVSQIAFDASVIASWIDRVRRRGTYLPIHIGLAGPVDRHKLVRISTRIGVGESLRFLRGHREWLPRLLGPRPYRPDRLLERLAPALADPANAVAGIHVYTFNAVEQTERWRRAAIERMRG